MDSPTKTEPPFVPLRHTGWASHRTPLWVFAAIIALAAANAYGVVALPQTFFLDARHRIVDRVYGAVTQADLAKGVRLMNASGS